MTGLDVERLEFDEIWSFVLKKKRRLTPLESLDPKLGDQFLFLATEPKTNAILAWHLGKRERKHAEIFLTRTRASLNGCRPQVSTDQWAGYFETVPEAFDGNVDYGIIRKRFITIQPPGRSRYAPARFTWVSKQTMSGNPDLETISTSKAERNNLTIRTFQRRFVRLGLGFSKKWENLWAACALHVAYFNLCWQPRNLGGISPAMAVGATDRLWSVADLVGDC